MKSLVFVLLWLGLCMPAFAQAPPPDVNNPTAVQWTASADHNAPGFDGYTLYIFDPVGVPLNPIDLGKPVPDGTNTCVATINVQPIKFGNGFTVQLRARAGSSFSDPAMGENKFNRVPGSPSKPVVK